MAWTTTSGVRRPTSSQSRNIRHRILPARQKCKQDLLGAFGINNADPKLPVIGIVSRFAAQKGFDLISQIMDRLAREEMIIVALGTGDKTYEEMFLRLNKQFPNKIAVKVAYDNAHRAQDRSRRATCF